MTEIEESKWSVEELEECLRTRCPDCNAPAGRVCVKIHWLENGAEARAVIIDRILGPHSRRVKRFLRCGPSPGEFYTDENE